jgi:hypothetical protein
VFAFYLNNLKKKIDNDEIVLLLTLNIIIMKTVNRIMDRTTFVFVWLTIGIISSALAYTFAVGLKTIFDL